MYTYRQIKSALETAPGLEPQQLFGQSSTSDSLAQLSTAPHLQSFLAEMKDKAKQALKTPLTTLPFSLFKSFDITGERQGYEKIYFERRGRLSALGLMNLFDPSPIHLTALEELIWEICNEYTWAIPAHLSRGNNTGREVDFASARQTIDLFAAETAHSLAEISTLFKDQLNPKIITRIRKEIEERIFQSLFHNPIPFWWETATFNWSAVCAGSVGMAALLLVDDRQELVGMVERVIRIMECFLAGFGEDGGCAEGIGYWQYGFGYYTYFSEMLYQYTGEVLNLFEGEKIRKIARFPAIINLSKKSFVPYSDGYSVITLHSGLVSRLAERLNFTTHLPYLSEVPSFHEDHCYRWAHLSRDLFWTNPAILQKSPPPETSYLNDLGVVVSRNSLQGTPVAFSAKGGHNDEPHNHNDLGNFILFLGKENLLTDLGAGVYTRQYFGPERYNFLHNSSQGHSVPVINGQFQQAGPEHKATVTHFEQKEDQLTFQLELKEAYALPALKTYLRTFNWQVNQTGGFAELFLTDYFNFNYASSSIEEVFISLHQPLIEVEKGTVLWRGSGGELRLNYPARWCMPDVETITTYNHSGEAFTVYRLQLKLSQEHLKDEIELKFSFTISISKESA